MVLYALYDKKKEMNNVVRKQEMRRGETVLFLAKLEGVKIN